MTIKVLKALPLTPENFTEFGAVLMAKGLPPHRDAYAGNIENKRAQAKPNLTFIHAAPKPPIIKAVERHEYSSQTFVPMNNVHYLVGVCPPVADGGPDLDELVVFLATPGQAVNYNAGVWHSPLCAIERPGEFIMLRWDDESPDDTELVMLEYPVEVLVDDLLEPLSIC